MMNNWKRIVGGEHVSIDVVPWQALIQQHLSLSDNNTTTTIQCGAVLIDPMWILSASHCIQQPWYRYPIDVYFGLTNITANIGQCLYQFDSILSQTIESEYII